MRFATPTAAYYCGIDLHARTMYLVVLDQAGPRSAWADAVPAADSKTGVNEKAGHNLRTQHGSGNFGATVTLRRGRGKYFLLTWETL